MLILAAGLGGAAGYSPLRGDACPSCDVSATLAAFKPLGKSSGATGWEGEARGEALAASVTALLSPSLGGNVTAALASAEDAEYKLCCDDTRAVRTASIGFT